MTFVFYQINLEEQKILFLFYPRFSIIPLINMSQMEVQRICKDPNFLLILVIILVKIESQGAVYMIVFYCEKAGAAKSSKDIKLNKELKVNIDILENSENLNLT